MSNSVRTIIIFIAGAVVLLAIVLGIYVFLRQTSLQGLMPFIKQKTKTLQKVVKISPSPASTPQDQWKTYTSEKAHMTFRIPKDWQPAEIDNKLRIQDQSYTGALSIGSLPYGPPYFILFASPVTVENGLNGIPVATGEALLKNHSYATISGYNARIDYRVYGDKPPVWWRGKTEDWHPYTQKAVYFDLGNNKIVAVESQWKNGDTEFEKTFDKMLSTIKFI